jgi:hypothetical protein
MSSQCRRSGPDMWCGKWITACIVLLASIVSVDPALSAPHSEEEDVWGGIRLFEADISARNQTTLTHSDGKGFAKVWFDINTMEITWEVEYDGLTSPPTGIHLHGLAQPGTNAVKIIDLGVNGLGSPITGTLKVPDAHIQYMLLGWTYVLLKTENYANGELRGKLDTVPPLGFNKDKGT